MKKLIFLALTTIMFFSASAQTTRFANRNNAESIALKTVTTDSAIHYVDSLVLGANEAGLVELKVIGFAKDTAYSVTGKLSVRFNKRRGTLTLGSVTQLEPITRDAVLKNTELGGATFTFSIVNNNLYVSVKGKDGYSITWMSILKYVSIRTYGS